MQCVFIARSVSLLVLTRTSFLFSSASQGNRETGRSVPEFYFLLLRPTNSAISPTQPYYHIYAPLFRQTINTLLNCSIRDAPPPLAPIESTDPRDPRDSSSPTSHPGPCPVSQWATVLRIGPPTEDVRRQTVDPTQTYRHRNWHGQKRPFVFRTRRVGQVLRIRSVGAWSCPGDSKRVAVGYTAWTRAVDEGVGGSGQRDPALFVPFTLILLPFTVTVTTRLTITPRADSPPHALWPPPPPPHRPPRQNTHRMGGRSDVPVDVS